ncbi:LLM class flavin-dependent oxidoreductase [Skermania sp. ID1734]|uniref:LLM class flavin-dependent oxidoreductase n=1 Tax=Skermania sp. ID1734 TaxID=2597516 RepID=UPI00118069B1|nr:LLM class flavin-dependent oxidoreductase [Skermania sp. ID1734]TSD93255.1 LLM class flavin-dependent oxidoreductase [Skermania sp. ID1734]
MRHGLWLAPFGQLADPVLLVDLARRAEASRWHGVFLWDHVEYGSPATPIADPWVALAAIAAGTKSIQIGTLVTPVPRRRVYKLARETATLDRLSGGRLVLGVGLGSGSIAEFDRHEAPTDIQERARSLDAGLDRITRCWSGDYQPVPVQRPRIPIWVGSEWPHRQPLRRAARWDGWFPVGILNPDDLDIGIAELQRHRPANRHNEFEVIASGEQGDDPRPYQQAGATWWLTGFGPNPRAALVRSVIDTGPWPAETVSS